MRDRNTRKVLSNVEDDFLFYFSVLFKKKRESERENTLFCSPSLFDDVTFNYRDARTRKYPSRRVFSVAQPSFQSNEFRDTDEVVVFQV